MQDKQQAVKALQALVTANLSNTLPVAEQSAATGTSLVVVAEPAITLLNRDNLTFNEKMAILKIETAKSLDEDDFIDEWDYEEGKGDKHENSSS